MTLSQNNTGLQEASGGKLSLAEVSLRLHAGEILGIAGISGNGQSELSRLISGETVLPHGRRDEIRMLDKPVGHLGPAARRALGFAFVPEERLAHLRHRLAEDRAPLRSRHLQMGIKVDEPAFVFGNNKSVLYNTTDPGSTLKKKSNAIAYHFVREGVARDEWRTTYINTDENVADLFTKP